MLSADRNGWLHLPFITVVNFPTWFTGRVLQAYLFGDEQTHPIFRILAPRLSHYPILTLGVQQPTTAVSILAKQYAAVILLSRRLVQAIHNIHIRPRCPGDAHHAATRCD